jgi:hypothetical protein
MGLCHTNKKADLSAIERLLGSVEYVNAARSVLLLRKEPEEQHLVRVMHAKANYSAKAGDLLFRSYNTEPKDHPKGQYIAIKWERPEEDIDVSGAYDRHMGQDDDVPGAGKWLLKHLSHGTWEAIPSIFEAGERYQHTKSAIRKAKVRSAGKIEHKPEEGKATHWRLAKARVLLSYVPCPMSLIEAHMGHGTWDNTPVSRARGPAGLCGRVAKDDGASRFHDLRDDCCYGRNCSDRGDH